MEPFADAVGITTVRDGSSVGCRNSGGSKSRGYGLGAWEELKLRETGNQRVVLLRMMCIYPSVILTGCDRRPQELKQNPSPTPWVGISEGNKRWTVHYARECNKFTWPSLTLLWVWERYFHGVLKRLKTYGAKFHTCHGGLNYTFPYDRQFSAS